MTSLLLLAALLPSAEPLPRCTVILVVGASGTPEYAREFDRCADLWQQASARGDAQLIEVGRGEAGDDRALLEAAIQAAAEDEAAGPLWLVLLGHGTFDGQTAKFNLRGPDVSAEDLAAWLNECPREQTVINAASSSGPFVNALSVEGRVVVTATKSGFEQNYARFGGYLAEAVADPGAGLDKDGQTSLLEAWLAASRGVADFYQAEGRLATEHALLDDNGDGRGTPANWFRGIRLRVEPRDGSPDGLRAHQRHLVPSDRERRMPPALRKRRDALELAISRLRGNKSTLEVDEYYGRLEPLLVELAELYTAMDAPVRAPVAAQGESTAVRKCGPAAALRFEER